MGLDHLPPVLQGLLCCVVILFLGGTILRWNIAVILSSVGAVRAVFLIRNNEYNMKMVGL